jgi:hypothetical protein
MAVVKPNYFEKIEKKLKSVGGAPIILSAAAAAARRQIFIGGGGAEEIPAAAARPARLGPLRLGYR